MDCIADIKDKIKALLVVNDEIRSFQMSLINATQRTIPRDPVVVGVDGSIMRLLTCLSSDLGGFEQTSVNNLSCLMYLLASYVNVRYTLPAASPARQALLGATSYHLGIADHGCTEEHAASVLAALEEDGKDADDKQLARVLVGLLRTVLGPAGERGAGRLGEAPRLERPAGDAAELVEVRAAADRRAAAADRRAAAEAAEAAEAEAARLQEALAGRDAQVAALRDERARAEDDIARLQQRLEEADAAREGARQAMERMHETHAAELAARDETFSAYRSDAERRIEDLETQMGAYGEWEEHLAHREAVVQLEGDRYRFMNAFLGAPELEAILLEAFDDPDD